MELREMFMAPVCLLNIHFVSRSAVFWSRAVGVSDMSTVDRGGHFFYFLVLLHMFWNNPAKILGAKYEAKKKKDF